MNHRHSMVTPQTPCYLHLCKKCNTPFWAHRDCTGETHYCSGQITLQKHYTVKEAEELGADIGSAARPSQNGG